MINGFPYLNLAHHSPPYEKSDLRQATLRRKSAHLWDCVRGAASGYPSPPMSSPPSPTRRPSDLTLPSTGSQQFVPTSTVPSTATSSVYPSEETRASISTVGLANVSGPAYHPPASFVSGPGLESLGPALGVYPSTPYAPPPSSSGRSGAQEGKKAKTHVASACVNCKRAHLSCDVQRPCARCVASGKQDTCYDVAHKKRGRPRLRDESQFALERTMPGSHTTTSPTTLMSTPTRPIASTRQRRAESFRSIQSMTSEESSTYGPPTPGFLPRPPAPFQTPLTYPPPARQAIPLVEPEVPTALLDLDFVIIRANTSFQQIMADNRNLTRSRLHEIAAPADSESFLAIRSRLRAEREAREPAFLPPIVPSGEDPLGGVSDAEVEKLTQGFSDQTYTWVQLKSGPRGSQTFPARVRLAKGATYFAVVTLPSFRPIEPAKPPLLPAAQVGSPYPFGPPLPPTEEALKEQRRQESAHSAPPSLLYPYEPIHGPTQHLRHRPPAPPRTYAQPQPQPQPQPQHHLQYPYPYQQPQSQLFLSAQPILGHPQEGRPVTTNHSTQPPSYGPATLPPPPPASQPRDVQLPPIAASPALALTSGPGPSGMPPIHGPPTTTAPATGAQRSSESDEDSEGRKLRSPRKRRRMGIDEVLQK